MLARCSDEDIRYSDEFIQAYNCIDYLQFCENTGDFTIQSLLYFASSNVHNLKPSFYVSSNRAFDSSEKPSKMTAAKIEKLLNPNYYTSKYNEEDWEDDDIDTYREVYRELFPIERLADLFLVMYLQFLETGKVIKKCKICGDFFIPSKKADEIYCRGVEPKGRRTCKEQGKVNKENQRRQNIISRTVRSITQMLSEKIGYGEDEANAKYNDFINENARYNSKYKKGEITESDYLKWLDTFYVVGRRIR